METPQKDKTVEGGGSSCKESKGRSERTRGYQSVFLVYVNTDRTFHHMYRESEGSKIQNDWEK